jgi:hypothetical protein
MNNPNKTVDSSTSSDDVASKLIKFLTTKYTADVEKKMEEIKKEKIEEFKEVGKKMEEFKKEKIEEFQEDLKLMINIVMEDDNNDDKSIKVSELPPSPQPTSTSAIPSEQPEDTTIIHSYNPPNQSNTGEVNSIVYNKLLKMIPNSTFQTFFNNTLTKCQYKISFIEQPSN